MIAVQSVSALGSECHFVVDILADGKRKTYQLAIEPIMVDEKTIERIVCEDGLTQLLHAHPATAQAFFRMIDHVYHGKQIQFPIDLDTGERDEIA